jgi:hypothetical protein
LMQLKQSSSESFSCLCSVLKSAHALLHNFKPYAPSFDFGT